MFVILLLSCVKNMHLATMLENLWLRGTGMPYVVVTGNPDMNRGEKKNYIYHPKTKQLILSCEDDYDHLCKKMLHALKAITQIFPQVTGVFKIDDDVFLSLPRFTQWVQNHKNDAIDYAGIRCKRMDYWSYYHYGKCSSSQMNMIPMYLSSVVYAQGPFYFLSRKSIDLLITHMKPEEHLYEDYLIGKTLDSHGIHFVDAPFYTESLQHFVLGNLPSIAFHDLHHVYNLSEIERRYSINRAYLLKKNSPRAQYFIMLKTVLCLVIVCIALRFFFMLRPPPLLKSP